MKRITGAINRMRGIGGICATRAALFDSLLTTGSVKLFNSEDAVDHRDQGYAPTGKGAKGWIALSTFLVDAAYDRRHKAIAQPYGTTVTLQLALAHELDHLFDLPHLEGNPVLTANAIKCSDVPNQ